MERHLYLSVMPEALVASQLPPHAFGAYYATGSRKKSRSQAMFFELDPDFRHEYFNIEAGYKRLVPHEDGSPKRSVYISIYRVLEHVPLSAIQKLYVTTRDGRTLGLDAADDIPESGRDALVPRDRACAPTCCQHVRPAGLFCLAK